MDNDGSADTSLGPATAEPTTASKEAGAELADQIATYVGRFVVIEYSHLIAATLWILHTWAFEAAVTTPYLFITSPQKQSGKSRLQEVVGKLVRRPLRVSGASEAALFRAIDELAPTILLDEVDVIFAGRSASSEPIRGLLDSGNREGGSILRCVVEEKKPIRVAPFNTFSAKCLAGIDKGDFPDTIMDRSVTLRVHRKRKDQSVHPFRFRDAETQAEPLREALSNWASGNLDALAAARPDAPEGLSDRAEDAWEPLFAIADLLGDVWPEAARHVAVELYEAERAHEDTVELMLLRAIRTLIGDEPPNSRWPTSTLLDRLNSEIDGEDAPWLEQGALTARSLAATLRPFAITPTTVRIGQTTMKGYKYEDFVDAWERYLPPPSAEVTV